MQCILRYSPFAVGAFLAVLLLYALPVEAGWFDRLFNTTTQIECDLLAAHPQDLNRVGEGVAFDKLDAGRAVEACKQAVSADPNNPRYQYQYGRALHNAGQYKDALKWFRKAIEHGYAQAQAGLGAMYGKGEGVAQSDSEAVKWYRKAAEQGHAGAQHNLGFMYSEGLGVAQDPVKAVKWYRKAADQSLVDAQYNVGLMYRHGQGIPQDEAEAVKWFRKAAEQGDSDAQAALWRGSPAERRAQDCDNIRKLAMSSSSQHKKRVILQQWAACRGLATKGN